MTILTADWNKSLDICLLAPSLFSMLEFTFNVVDSVWKFNKWANSQGNVNIFGEKQIIAYLKQIKKYYFKNVS